MPMLMEQLRNKDSVNIENIKKTKPQRISYADDEEYNAALTAYNKRMEEALKKNKEIHRALLNRDYRTVLSNFITQAAHFNAIQDNKYMLYYGKEMLDRMEVYQKNVGWSNLKKDHQRGARGETRYLTQKMKDFKVNMRIGFVELSIINLKKVMLTLLKLVVFFNLLLVLNL